MENKLNKRPWSNYIHEDIRELFEESVQLVSKVKAWQEDYHDYAFVVFPAAKGYEGFLKQLFLDLNLISERDYYGKRFRVGKALNPSLEAKFRRESVYDRLVKFCNGTTLADKLWNTWKLCRNLVFHWFPKEKNAISFSEAESRVEMIFEAVDQAFKECKIER